MADQITEGSTPERTVRVWGSDKNNFTRNFAVFIGIDCYAKHPAIRNLTTAVHDANAIADLLQKDYEYKSDNVIRLKNEEATLDALQNLFDTRIQKELNPGEDDRLIIYFAGHGLARSSNNKGGPEGYLVPHNADPTDDSSFLAMRNVYNALEKLECHHLLVILDCCFAGTFRWAGSRKSIPILETIHQEHYYHFIRHPAWQVITSSAHDQEALDVARLKEDNRQPDQWNKPHSPFALALLEGLQPGDDPQRVQADLFPDGVVTAHELFVYLQTRVKQLSGEQQAPGIYPLRREYDRGEFVFTSSKFDPKQLDEALPLNEDNNPYRGLNSFDEKHADFFFGRQALVDKLADRLSKHDQALTVVLGISGSGKSSLVKAGLLPCLRNQKSEQKSNQWYILDPMRPGEVPFISLARVLLPLVDAELLKQVAQMNFLDKLFQPVPETRTKAKQDLASVTQDQQVQPDETLIKVADLWCNAKPEAKLLLIEDYFTQLDALLEKSGNSQQRKRLKDWYDRILTEIDSISKKLEQERQYLSRLVAIWSQQHSGVRLVLVIDQFEELLTRTQDNRNHPDQTKQQETNRPTEKKEWQKFLEVLRIAIAEQCQTLRLVLTLRSDFEPRFLSSALEPYWKDARFPVRAMTSDELRQVIENPALKQALYFEELKDEQGNTTENLVSKLVDEVGQMPGALPLLSFTLSELYVRLYKRWEAPTYTGRTLLFEDYEDLGGVAGALTRRATQEYDALNVNYQATMRRVMLRMVAIDGGGIARRRVAETELTYEGLEDKRVKQVVSRLVEARLLVRGQEIGEPYVEPAHDFLMKGWNQLQEWIKEDQENIVLQRKLFSAATDWNGIKEKEKLPEIRAKANIVIGWLDQSLFTIENLFSNLFYKLLRPLRHFKEKEKVLKESSTEFLWHSNPSLNLLDRELNSKNNWLNKVENTFVKRSISQKRKNTSWRRRITTGIIVGLSGLTIIAYIKQQESQQEAMRALTAIARTRLSEDQEFDALIQAIRAAEIAQRTVGLDSSTLLQTKLVLAQAISSVHEFNRWIGNYGHVAVVKFSPDGRLLATGGNDGETGVIRIWNLQGRLLSEMSVGRSNIRNIRFSPDGKALAILRLDEKILLWKFEDNSSYEILLRTNSSKESQSSFWESLYDDGDGERVEDGIVVNCLDKDVEAVVNYNNETLSRSNFIEFHNRQNQSVFRSVADGSFLNSLDCHPNQAILASAGEDGSVRLWRLPRRPLSFQANNIDISSNGKEFFLLKGNTIEIREINGELLNSIQLQTLNSPHDVAFASQDRKVVSIDNENVIRLWDFNSNSPKAISVFETYGSKIISIGINAQGTLIVGLEDDRKTIRVWNAYGELLNTFSHQRRINKLTFSPDSTVLASASHDGMVRLWNLENQKALELEGHRDFVWDVSFSHNGKFLVSAGADRTVRIWSIQGQLVDTFKSEGIVKRVDFSLDDNIIAATGLDERVAFWERSGILIDTQEATLQTEQSYGMNVLFSPDNQKLFLVYELGIGNETAIERRIELWNLSLDDLLELSCDWLSDYLLVQVEEKPSLCSSQ
jgi:WD40 repeat protein